MSETTEIIKNYAPLVTPFIPAIVDVFVKPKLQRLAKFLKKNDAQSLISVEAQFTEYLERSYKKHSFIPILIFQNQQRKLEDIYIPLTVRRERENETFLIDEYPQGFLPKYKKVLIRDTAGMGKSTLMKRLFLSALEEQKGIPVFIELRKLKGDDTIVNFIHRELNAINDEFDADDILNLIKDGNFIFFFDGYDEISQSEREKVTLNLHDFISKTGNNLFIMTSRPEISLASFPDFMEFDIQPLELEEAFALLCKYDQDGELSAEIISKLKGDILENVKEFLGNPLLVSLLYKSYEYKHTIPLKKHTFYRQVYDALFESHDLTKEGAYIRDKHCQLDSDSFHAVLRALAFITIKHGVEYDKDTILSFIKKAKTQCSTIEFKESKFLDDLLQTVPIFTKEGTYYRWSHKSLQDYFATQFIWLDTGEKKSEVLRKIVQSNEFFKYSNVLDIYYDVDYKTFRQTVIYDFLCSLTEHYEKPYKIETNQPLDEIGIKIYKILTFIGTIVFMPNYFFHPGTTQISSREIGHFLFGRNLTIEGFLAFTIGKGFCCFVNADYSFSNFFSRFLERKNEAVLFDTLVPFFDVIERAKLFSVLSKETIIFVSNKTLIINKIEIDPIKVLKHLLYVLSKNTNYLPLDIDKCIKMKAEIEAEIEREKANDLYDNL